MFRRSRLASVLAVAVGVLLPVAGCTEPTKPPAPKPIASMGALGDSISRAFDACSFLKECPQASWSTGSDPTVDSHYRRLLARNPSLAGHVWSVAKLGATSADLPGQAALLALHRPDYVTLLAGANDACAGDESQMTPTTVFRANVDAALATLYQARPDEKVLVASIPNLYRLWQVAHTNSVAQLAWSTGFCRSMLDNPTSLAGPDEARRRRVQAQVISYNTQLAEACRTHPGCRFDDNAVYDYPFSVTQLSPYDYFHPNPAGQKVLASITWGNSEF